MKITKKELKKLIRESLPHVQGLEKEPSDAPPTNWELAMEKVYDMVDLLRKSQTLGNEALSKIVQEHDELEGKAFRKQRQTGIKPDVATINKLRDMENTIDKVRVARKAINQIMIQLKDFN